MFPTSQGYRSAIQREEKVHFLNWIFKHGALFSHPFQHSSNIWGCGHQRPGFHWKSSVMPILSCSVQAWGFNTVLGLYENKITVSVVVRKINVMPQIPKYYKQPVKSNQIILSHWLISCAQICLKTSIQSPMYFAVSACLHRVCTWLLMPSQIHQHLYCKIMAVSVHHGNLMWGFQTKGLSLSSWPTVPRGVCVCVSYQTGGGLGIYLVVGYKA